MKSSRQDVLIRILFITAGAVAAILFTLHGQGEALPSLALGGLIGACLVNGATGGAAGDE